MRFREFYHKSIHYKIGGSAYTCACKRIIELREELEGYLKIHSEFMDSLVPVTPLGNPPLIARRMMDASRITGLGPMASVAGVIAQMTCERVRQQENMPSVLDNGGDLFLDSEKDLSLGIYGGENLLEGKLAFRIPVDMMPLAVCSSSGIMGHSLSFGHCDLATVFSKDGALADSAATLAGNLVKSPSDLKKAVNHILNIPGIEGVFLLKGDQIGLGGRLPEIISSRDPDIKAKVTRDRSRRSSFTMGK